MRTSRHDHQLNEDRQTGVDHPGGLRTAVAAPRPGGRAPLLLVERIIALGRGWSRRQHELCRLLADYDLSGDWAFSGAVTCSKWAADALEVEAGTAREWLRVGHALRELRDIDAAFADGSLSFSKVRALTRLAVDHPDRQAELVQLAVGCTAAALPWELARWSSSEEDPLERDRRHRREMSLSVRTEPDGSALLTARLPPVDAAVAMAAIDAGRRRDVGVERLTVQRAVTTKSGQKPTAERRPPPSVRRPSLAARRAAALVGLLADDGSDSTAARPIVSTELLIHVLGDGARLSDGTPIAGHLVEQLAPAAFFRALIHDAERRPINASGRQRHPTTRQQRVVSARDDHTCTAPGCDSRQFLEVDHDPPYEVTKRTVVDELRLLCGAHHRQRHGPDDAS